VIHRPVIGRTLPPGNGFEMTVLPLLFRIEKLRRTVRGKLHDALARFPRSSPRLSRAQTIERPGSAESRRHYTMTRGAHCQLTLLMAASVLSFPSGWEEPGVEDPVPGTEAMTRQRSKSFPNGLRQCPDRAAIAWSHATTSVTFYGISLHISCIIMKN
jgi:hypothetical protein